MYRISFEKNKDFSRKECFLSGKIFRPGKVIAELARKCRGSFQPIGFIRMSEIKEFNLMRKQFPEIPFHIFFGFPLRGMRDEQAKSEIRNIMQWFDMRMAPIREAAAKIGHRGRWTLSLKEYKEALRKQGINC